MKTNVLAFACATAVTTFANGLPAFATDNLNYEKINYHIREAMTEAMLTSSVIERFTYEMDPQFTDLRNDRYAITMNLEGKEPWSDETFSARARIQLSRDQAQPSRPFNVSSKMELSTDTLAFIRHHAAKNSACNMAPHAQGIMRLALAEDCYVTPDLAKVNSFDELHQILLKHIDHARTSLTAYHSDLTKSLAVAEQDISKEIIQQQLIEAENYLKAINESKLMRTVDGVQFQMTNVTILGMIDLKNVTIDFSPAKTRLNCEFSFQMGTVIYDATKPEILQLFKDLEAGRDYAKKLIQMETRMWIRLIESHIQGAV